MYVPYSTRVSALVKFQLFCHIIGWENKQFFPSRLPLIILMDSYIQVYDGILMHPILIYAKECVGGCEAKS